VIVTIKDIQGFYGEHTFEIKDGITMISAKFNGTGKTTFFDCLRALTVPHTLSKEDKEFLVNFTKCKGLFSIEINGDLYGFECDRKDLIFFRHLDGDVLEKSIEPFEDGKSFVNVFEHEGIPINICDRFSNLFSGSHGAFNNSLLESLLKDAKLERFLEITEEDLKESQCELISLQERRDSLIREIDSIQHYPKLKKFQGILEDENLVITYNALKDIFFGLSSICETKGEISLAGVLEFSELYEILKGIEFTPVPVYLDEALIPLYNLQEEMEEWKCVVIVDNSLEVILPILEDIDKWEGCEYILFKLEVLLDLQESLQSWEESTPVTIELVLVANVLETLLSIQPMTKVQTLLSEFTSILEDLMEVEISGPKLETSDLEIFFSIINSLREIKDNLDSLEENRYLAKKSENTLLKYKYKCPVKGMVYIVGGECVNV